MWHDDEESRVKYAQRLRDKQVKLDHHSWLLERRVKGAWERSGSPRTTSWTATTTTTIGWTTPYMIRTESATSDDQLSWGLCFFFLAAASSQPLSALGLGGAFFTIISPCLPTRDILRDKLTCWKLAHVLVELIHIPTLECGQHVILVYLTLRFASKNTIQR